MHATHSLRTDRPRFKTHRREPVRIDDVGVARLLLTELDLGMALRVVLALLLHILQLRVDSLMLSRHRAGEIRNGILQLVKQIIAPDQDAVAEALPRMPATKAAPAAKLFQPVSAPAGDRPVERRNTSWSEQLPGPILVDGIRLDSLLQLSVKELREFARVAAKDSKPLFEQALLTAYRRHLLAMFCGPFSVKQATNDFNFPDFELTCRSDKTIVLKRYVGARPSDDSCPDAYEMVRQHWHSRKRPQNFRIEEPAAEPARTELASTPLSASSSPKN
ncbi:MAG: hypothetical protein ACRETN_03075 [Nevskiales bacterium]